MNLIDAVAPQGFAGLPAPDAVFFGGGVTLRGIEAAFHALKPFGRLVANAVTLESIQTLVTAHQLMGGELTQINVARAEPVGPFRGWRALMPVTQWGLVKR